jgi:hypothetical protein
MGDRIGSARPDSLQQGSNLRMPTRQEELIGDEYPSHGAHAAWSIDKYVRNAGRLRVFVGRWSVCRFTYPGETDSVRPIQQEMILLKAPRIWHPRGNGMAELPGAVVTGSRSQGLGNGSNVPLRSAWGGSPVYPSLEVDDCQPRIGGLRCEIGYASWRTDPPKPSHCITQSQLPVDVSADDLGSLAFRRPRLTTRRDSEGCSGCGHVSGLSRLGYRELRLSKDGLECRPQALSIVRARLAQNNPRGQTLVIFFTPPDLRRGGQSEHVGGRLGSSREIPKPLWSGTGARTVSA